MEKLNIDDIKKILDENASLEDKKSDINFDLSLMENKLKFDLYLLELLTLATLKEKTEEKKEILEEIIEKLFEKTIALYEVFDLKPIVKGMHILKEENLLVDEDIFNVCKKILQEEVDLLVENIDKKLSKHKDTIKELSKRFLLETKNLDVAIKRATDFILLSELIDKILFPSVNYYIVFENKLEDATVLDEKLVDEIKKEYINARDEFIKNLLN